MLQYITDKSQVAHQINITHRQVIIYNMQIKPRNEVSHAMQMYIRANRTVIFINTALATTVH